MAKGKRKNKNRKKRMKFRKNKRIGKNGRKLKIQDKGQTRK